MDATEIQGRSMRFIDTLGEDCQRAFLNFLENFKNGDKLKYLEEANQMNIFEKSTLPISFNDLREFNISLSNQVMLQFFRLNPFLCKATKKFINDVLPETENNGRDYQCSFIDFPTVSSLRDMTKDRIGKLVRFRATVIRSHAVHPELVIGSFKCTDCQSKIKNVEQQFIYTKPSICSNRNCMNRIKFDLILDESKFVDFQKLRVQEIQDELPKGCVPRSLEVILRGELVDKVQPGDLVEFIGIMIVIPDVSQMATPGCRTLETKPLKTQAGYDTGLTGLKILGVRELTYRNAFLAQHVVVVNNRFLGGSSAGFNEDEELTYESLKTRMTEEEMCHVLAMSRDPNLTTHLASNLFPRIYGNDEVKRGHLLMLFGGVSKQTPEGTKLRGDMNVCLVGDPSTAKSQFLKRVAHFAPRAVYTSGKASSAAGLTAAVVRDQESSEFVIEPGALLLANKGICCIDEFDKMNVRDQVALHEAMEQQTISITKAGVKASLKARTSVLAAANPMGGRYDRSRSLRQNIAISPPLMSRFDLFFVLVDACDEHVDRMIAQQIMDNITRGTGQTNNNDRDKSVHSDEDIRRYIAFARCFEPRISTDAGNILVNEYKKSRSKNSGAQAAWRMTVRQLESLTRLAEAIAKMRFSDWVEVVDVTEAARLLNKTIVQVEQPDIQLSETIDVSATAPTDQGDGDVAMEGGAAIVSVSYEEYRAMSDSLIGFLRAAELESPETGGQVLRSALVEWYLGTVVDTISDEEELLNKKHLAEMVIQRLVDKDHMLMATYTSKIGTGAGHQDSDTQEHVVATEADPIISLHPNVPLL